MIAAGTPRITNAHAKPSGVAPRHASTPATESIGKALIATIVPKGERGRAYGLYYLIWGLAWWAGSILLGALYDHSRALASAVASGALVAGSIVVALSARVAKPAT